MAKILSPTVIVFLIRLMASILPTTSSAFAAPIMQARMPATAALFINRITSLLRGGDDLSRIERFVQPVGDAVDRARPTA